MIRFLYSTILSDILTRILIYGVLVRQRSEDIDVAHVEELKILADEHEQQLEILRNQLTEQIDKMSAEAEAIQAEHEADIQKEKVRVSLIL